MPTLLRTALTVLGVALLALLLTVVVHRVTTRLGRRSVLLADLARQAHRPFQVTVVVYAVQQALRSAGGDFPGRSSVLHALVLGVIAAVAWLVAALLLVIEDASLSHWRTDVPDNVRARRLHTQVVMLRRVTVAAIVVVTIGVMLMTFPGVRAVGGGVLASAGVISVVAALAAQSTLGNLIAGLQLAFSNALRLDDVVVVEKEWGRIEELTLSYVVVQIWDDRRLILPTSYFTTKPYQHWTRENAELLGTAEFDVDWRVPVEAVRTELTAVCESTELWDRRVCVLQVIDAIDHRIRLRALISAHDAGTLWDLRCLVRERLVSWLVLHHPEALPRWRTERMPAVPAIPRQPAVDQDAARVFGGSPDGEARSASFEGPDSVDDRSVTGRPPG